MGTSDSAAMAGVEPPTPENPETIWDPFFRRAHERLHLLSAYSLQIVTALDPKAQEAARLGNLKVAAFSLVPYRGRRASPDEWSEVETRTRALWSSLSEPQRRQFASTQVPGWFSYVITALLVLALAAVVLAVFASQHPGSGVLGGLLMPFLAFVVALGAMGAGASIGMNALAVQDDVTFDLSSPKFLWLRLVLGALLGTMLTISWAYPGFQKFIAVLATNAPADAGGLTTDQLVPTLWLLAPFVLGFSTPLVILILTRAVEALQTFFGKASGPGQ